MAFLDQNPGLGYPAAAGLGLLLGSFLNVVILRLPRFGRGHSTDSYGPPPMCRPGHSAS